MLGEILINKNILKEHEKQFKEILKNKSMKLESVKFSDDTIS